VSDGAPYARRVSFNERLYLAAERMKPGFCIQIVVEGEGELAVDALRDAVARATAANPGARLVLRGVLGWMRWVPRGPVPPVRVVGAWPEGDAVPPDLEQPLPPTTGPTCEVVLSRGPRPRVVFRCFHGVMDARGLLHFAEEVFRALRGEELVGAPSCLSDTEVVTSTVGKRTRPALASDCPTVTGSSNRRTSPVLWRRVTLEGPMPGLVARIAAALARHAKRSHEAQTRVMIPVDLRNYRRDLRNTGNMTYPLFLDVPVERGWRDLQKDILKRLAAKEPMQLDPAEGVLPWLPMWLVRLIYAAWLAGHRRSGRYPFSALLTHVALQGVAELVGAGFSSRSLYFLPLQTDFIPLGIAVVSSADAAHVVVSAPEGLLSEGQLTELCDVLRSEIRSEA
jgi:hypothetical protein